MSIVRVGLSETKDFSEGWERIFGKKDKDSQASANPNPSEAKAESSPPTPATPPSTESK
jgi:hypothetical protein